MSPNVIIKKIVDLLSSEDEELRILGLSYLNNNKTNRNLCVSWHADSQKYRVISCHRRLHSSSFDKIYYTLQGYFYYIVDKDILLPYVKYCYGRKNC